MVKWHLKGEYMDNHAFLHENKTGLIAHRGCCVFAPENTLKSIQKAGELGYEMVELDVNRTSDGVLILMHDNTVDRTTDGTGAVSELTFEQIKQLNADVQFTGRNLEEIIKVPTFEEAVSTAAEHNLGINVDCSKLIWNEGLIHEVVPLLKKYAIYEKSFFVISDSASRDLLGSLYPDVSLTWLSSDAVSTNNIAEVKKYKNAFVTYSNRVLTDQLLGEYKKEGIPIFVHSCNTTSDVQKWIGKDARFIETDCILP
jgi:glycerophosphoryl diester phosphodiesterase